MVAVAEQGCKAAELSSLEHPTDTLLSLVSAIANFIAIRREFHKTALSVPTDFPVKMEALAAVSLAGNILQFIHTTKELLLISHQLSESGAKSENIELEIIAKSLRARVERLDVPRTAVTTHRRGSNDSLESLAVKCKEIVDEILAVLVKLKLENDSSKWEGLHQALRAKWHEREIDALRKRLNDIGQAVNVCLAEEGTATTHELLDYLIGKNRALEISRAQELKELRAFFDEALADNREKLLDEGRLANQMHKTVSWGLSYSAEQLILSKLHFNRLDDRYSSISTAHRNTLSWLFESEEGCGQDIRVTTFGAWLQSDHDLYWISGRPGSGKSTLMKFLCDHPSTAKHLKTWAGDEVIVAEYFFWNAGKNELQKSQEGLVRSLLYQVLRKCPDNIRLVFPGAWRLYKGNGDVEPHSTDSTLATEVPLDMRGLLNALKHTCAFLEQSDRRLCFFIDGLDEYVGATVDVIELTAVLRKLPNVKLCISSRQWNEFEDAYGESRSTKLYMQDFNSKDINAYIDDEVQGEALIEEIVAAANGVFLWVVLVVRSFQEGLRQGDSITRLRNRLRELPTNLEEYFERILFHDVQKTYRDQAAQMFLVALAAKENLPLMAYWFLDEQELPTERQELKAQQTSKRHRAAKKRLIASCKGLLEPYFQSTVDENESLPSSVLFQQRVDFLHRTVRDYLALPTTDIKHWASANFDANEAICRVLYAQIMTAPQSREYGPQISALYQIFAFHANIAQNSHTYCESIKALNGNLEVVLSEYGVAVERDLGTGGSAAEICDAETPVLVVSPMPKENKHSISTLKVWTSKLKWRRSKGTGNEKQS
ncbi:hypothetical protein HBI69_124190 [Parastagonospora nodorum]|nr:hypothetical protein HBI69_124190 [Parastagonospora nodorum]